MGTKARSGLITDPYTFPVLVSAKLDGIRVTNGVMRSGKPIPNRYIREQIEQLPSNLDGELVATEGDRIRSFSETTALVRSHDTVGEFRYYLFDHTVEGGFAYRMDLLRRIRFPSFVKYVNQKLVHSQAELEAAYVSYLAANQEGMMIRDVHGAYSGKRVGRNSQELVKIKPMQDAEAIAMDFLPLVRADGTVEEMLGAINAGTFSVGTGFTSAQRIEFWKNREELKGKTFRYLYLPSAQTNPRHPVFDAWRLKEDIDADPT